MRKKLLARILLVFALILSILVCTIPEDSAHAAKVTNKKVQKVLKKNLKNKFCKYAFLDLDKDGLDELISYQYEGPYCLSKEEEHYTIYIEIFKYSGGKSKVIFSNEYLMFNNNYDISFNLYYKDNCYMNITYQEEGYAGDCEYYMLSKGTFQGFCFKTAESDDEYSYYLSDWTPTTEKKFNKTLKKFPGDDSKLEIKLKLSDKKTAKKFVKEYLTAMIPVLSEGKESVISEVKDSNGDGFADLKLKYASGESVIYSMDLEYDSLRLLQYTDVSDNSEEVREYVKENYPGLMKLADEGLISFSAEYERDTFKLGNWDMEYWEKSPESSEKDPKYVLVTDGIKEDIEWDVLGYSEDGQYAYAISRYILFNRQFNDKKAKVNFSNSTLCKYLNGEFYENAFSESEKELIGDSSANSQNHKVTILTVNDMRLFWNYDMEIASKERVATYIDGETGSWWTRSDGAKYNDDYESYKSNQSMKRPVLYDGSIESTRNGHNEEDDVGLFVNSSCGVRPYITVRLTPEFIEANNLSVGKVKPNLKKVFVIFGTHNISETSSVQMEWEILDYDEESGKTLLASRYIEKIIAYDDKENVTETTWKDCTLRKWLNSEFYEEAFSKDEKALIAANTYSEGEDMEDNVFILSYSEVEKYYPITNAGSIIDRICALRNGASRDWWLRTPDEESGITSAYVALITADGGSCKPYAELANEGFCDESLWDDDYDYGIFDHAVRPAIYLKTK